MSVEAGLDGDHVARHELVSQAAEPGSLVDREADPVAGPVVEAVLQNLSLGLVQLRRKSMVVEEVADEPMHVLAVHPRTDLCDREVERLLHELLVRPDLVGGLAHDEDSGHVRIAGGLTVDREQVEQHDLVDSDLARTHVVPHRGLRAVRDDRLFSRGPVCDEGRVGAALEKLAGEPVAVYGEPAVAMFGAREDVSHRGHGRLGCLLCPANSRQLCVRLHAPSSPEVLGIRHQLDPGRAQVVRDPRREVLGHERAPETERAAGTERDLARDLVGPEAPVEELIDAELFQRRHLDAEIQLLDPSLLE